MMKNFNWKTAPCNDFSGVWQEAKIKELNWIYSVDFNEFQSYSAYCYFGAGCEDIVLKEGFKTIELAKKYCEDHFSKIVDKIVKKYQVKN